VQQGVLDLLNRYPWPGNVRELENLVEQWFAKGRNESVTVADLPAELVAQAKQAVEKVAGENLADILPLRDTERALVRKALEAADQNKSKAANLLGISRKKLYKLLGDDASPESERPS
jgi:DNA-binding NtrC family response regulator